MHLPPTNRWVSKVEQTEPLHPIITKSDHTNEMESHLHYSKTLPLPQRLEQCNSANCLLITLKMLTHSNISHISNIR